MDTFVISLKESIKRRENFDKFNKNIINYQYYEAINGNNLTSDELKIILNSNSFNYPKGALGCAKSHLNLWNKCININKPIVIMEDDAFVSKDFNKHLKTVFKMLPEKWDILQLTYNCDSVLAYNNTNFEKAYTIFKQTKFNDEDIYNFQTSQINPSIAKLNMSFGLGCYVISPKGAKFLKENCFPMDNRIINIPFHKEINCISLDCMMNYFYEKINAYVCPIPFVMTKHLHLNYESNIKN